MLKKGLRTWIALFICGTINNLVYVEIISAAQSLAQQFGQENLIGLIPWANVAFGILVKALNAFYLEAWSYKVRMLLMGIVYLAGLVVVAISTKVNFAFCIFGIVLTGSASAFGESVMLGYLRLHDPGMVSSWSSGTGFAGVGGAGLYLLLVAVGLSNLVIFLLMMPLVFLYWFAFFFMIDRKDEIRHQQQSPPAPISAKPDSETSSLLSDSASSQERLWTRVFRVNMLVLWVSLNLGSVYFSEYSVSTGMADLSTKGYKNSDRFEQKNAYIILQFCYQFGVLISRSSLKFFKIRRVDVISFLQFLNFVLWMFQAGYKFMDVWTQFASMVFVGLLGGASYVNVFYLIFNDSERISDSDRELATNICSIWVNCGIMLACSYVLLMDNTFAKHW
eukprot:ANDGO_06646.mRNA.1 Battenin